MFDLKQEARERLLIAAHRGTAGGNIPCNTLAAFDAALMQGADIIELDVAKSKDGELFIFHPKLEFSHLGSDRLIAEMTAQEVRRLRYLNRDRTPTSWPVSSFDDAMEHLKNRCYINIDKFADDPETIIRAIRRHGIEDQVLVKTTPNDRMTSIMEALAPDLNYMVMAWHEDAYSEILLKRKVHFVGVEVFFASEDEPVAQESYVHTMQHKGLLVWANSIVCSQKTILSAHHDDDVSMTGNPDNGWGWLLKRGYNIIQTDWPLPLRLYAQSLKDKR